MGEKESKEVTFYPIVVSRKLLTHSTHILWTVSRPWVDDPRSFTIDHIITRVHTTSFTLILLVPVPPRVLCQGPEWPRVANIDPSTFSNSLRLPPWNLRPGRPQRLRPGLDQPSTGPGSHSRPVPPLPSLGNPLNSPETFTRPCLSSPTFNKNRKFESYPKRERKTYKLNNWSISPDRQKISHEILWVNPFVVRWQWNKKDYVSLLTCDSNLGPPWRSSVPLSSIFWQVKLLYL